MAVNLLAVFATAAELATQGFHTYRKATGGSSSAHTAGPTLQDPPFVEGAIPAKHLS